MHSNGNVYVGEWKDNKNHGQGLMLYKDGTIFSSTYQDNYLNGQGMYLYPDKTAMAAEWRSNERNGSAYQMRPDGKMASGFSVVKSQWEKGEKVECEVPLNQAGIELQIEAYERLKLLKDDILDEIDKIEE